AAPSRSAKCPGSSNGCAARPEQPTLTHTPAPGRTCAVVRAAGACHRTEQGHWARSSDDEEVAMSVDLTAIREAAEVLRPVVQRTPVEYSGALSARAGCEVWLKCENLQTGGSFKIRGSYIRMSRLPVEQRQAGVLAASAGNHAQGVALAARMLGISATIYMPEGAALPKVAATEGYGAEVRLHGATVEEAL